MPHYRVYVLDEHSQLTAAVNLACTDDDAAKEHAKRLADGQEVELWRLVAQFKLDDPPDRTHPLAPVMVLAIALKHSFELVIEACSAFGSLVM
jgi:hypothetical protein